MSAVQRAREAHEARLRLLEGRYVPMPNHDKRLFIEGWPDVEVTREWLMEHRAVKYQAAGVRMHDHLLAIDVDVDDREIVDELWVRLRERMPGLDECLVRHSGGDKEMWIARCDERFKFASSAKYVRPGADPEDKDAPKVQVEVFGGLARKQIAVFGAHTLSDDGHDLIKEYAYDGPSILDTPYDQLPVLPWQEVQYISLVFGDLMDELGWPRARTFGAVTDGNFTRYDLPAGPFETASGPVPYENLHHYDSCRMQEITGEGTNTERGRIYDFDGWTGVWDSETQIIHMPPEAEPSDVTETVVELADRLAALPMGERLLEEAAQRIAEERREMRVADLVSWREDGWLTRYNDDQDWDAQLDEWLDENDLEIPEGEPGRRRKLLEAMAGRAQLIEMAAHLSLRYAWYGLGTAQEEVYDIALATPVSLKNLRTTHCRMAALMPATTPAGKPTTKMMEAVDVWLRSSHRVTITGFDFQPGKDELFRPGDLEDTVKLNLYRPKIFSADPMPSRRAGELFMGFLGHLFPNDRERDFVLNHVVGMRQHPEMRGQAVLMISARGGVGRNTFFQILDGLFDNRFAHTLRSVDLVGDSARFNDWEERCLMCHVDELATVLAATNTSKFAAMAQIDDRVDPLPQRKTVEGKGQSRRTETVWWSLWAATMEPDAIALEPRDRRWTVLENTEIRISENPVVSQALAQMQGGVAGDMISEEFLHGLCLWLDRQEFNRELFLGGIWTEAKDQVVAAAEGDIEMTLRTVLARLQQDEKTEAWVDNLVVYVQAELGQQHKAHRKVKVAVPKLLKQGFAGWKWNVSGTLRTLSDTLGTEERVRGVARQDGAPSISPQERAAMLGAKRTPK